MRRTVILLIDGSPTSQRHNIPVSHPPTLGKIFDVSEVDPSQIRQESCKDSPFFPEEPTKS